MNVLVYSGLATSPPSLSHTLSTLRAVLLPHYAVQPVAPQTLAAHPWAATCALLVFPAFLPTATSPGAVPPPAATAVQKYAERGGKVLILGSDVHVHESRARVSLAAGIESVTLADTGLLTLTDGESRLNFSVGATKGNMLDAAGEPATLTMPDGVAVGPLLRVPGGQVDLTDVTGIEGFSVLAHYGSSDDARTAAGIKTRIGDGAVTFWSTHLEYSTREEIVSSILAKSSAPTPEELAKAEDGRIHILRDTLVGLGLTLPAQGSGVARPTAQVLIGAPWRPAVVLSVLKELEVPDLLTVSEKGYEFKDSNDTFIIHPASATADVFGVDQAKRYPSEDSATWNPKHIVVFEGRNLPARELVPRFDLEAYYAALEDARMKQECPPSYTDEDWGMGEALLYGEVVTSTQTMLDKCVCFILCTRFDNADTILQEHAPAIDAARPHTLPRLFPAHWPRPWRERMAIPSGLPAILAPPARPALRAPRPEDRVRAVPLRACCRRSMSRPRRPRRRGHARAHQVAE